MMSKKQREGATLAKLAAFSSRAKPPDASRAPQKVEGKPAGGAGELLAHRLDFKANAEKRMAEAAPSISSFDPLRHGGDAERSLAKIRERDKQMQSMKGDFVDAD